jgi:tetratricopeptide (TPR) repeat protein
VAARTLLALSALPSLLGSAAVAQPAAPPSSARQEALDALVEQADAAREAGRFEEAEALYRRVLQRRPRWAAGFGHLGTMAYERDRFAECRDAFLRFLELDASSGPAWALKGLCEFALASYPAARRSLDRALERGGLAEPLLPVVLYQAALVRIRASAFEAAIPPLGELAAARGESPELAAACGLLLLRRPLLPAAIPAADRDLVVQSGRAYCSYLARRGTEARARFAALVAAYPRERHLHYGYGLLLAQQSDPEAAAQFREEIELHPDHALAHLELAFELLRRGKPKDAVPAARAAARLAPDLFATHLALGRALVESGDLRQGILALEKAAALGPGVRETFWALAGAYARDGRVEEAEAARETVRRIDAALRARAPAADGDKGKP